MSFNLKRLSQALLSRKTTSKSAHCSSNQPKQETCVAKRQSNQQIIELLLKNCQCEIKDRSNIDKKLRNISYVFQNGNFDIWIHPEQNFLHIHYPGFYEEDFEEIENVRFVANTLNVDFAELKIVYTVSKESQKINVHVTTQLRLGEYDDRLRHDFTRLMGLCFEASREFRVRLQSIKASHANDYEKSYKLNEFEAQLALESEMKMQVSLVKDHISDPECITLGTILHNILSLQNARPTILTEYTDTVQTWQSAEDINSYSLLGSIIQNDEGGQPSFVRDNVLLYLEYLTTGDKAHALTITISQELSTTATLYARVIITGNSIHETVKPTPSNPLTTRGLNTTTFIIGYDFRDAGKHLEEFDYHWQEAHNKLANNQQSELTPAQKFIVAITDLDVSYNIYWGRQRFLDHRYVEAILHLECVYDYFNTERIKTPHTNNESDLFYEVIYYLGYSYYQIGQYRQAYFFLDLTLRKSNIRYIKAYVQLLNAANDVRLFDYLEHIMLKLDMMGNREVDVDVHEDTDENLFSNFEAYIKSVYAKLLIRGGNLYDARKFLTNVVESSHSQQVIEMAKNLIKDIEQIEQNQL